MPAALFIPRAATSLPVSVVSHSYVAKQIWGSLKLLLAAGIAVLIIIVVLFFLMKQLPGGEPLLAQKGLTEQARNALIKTYGLDLPVFTQFTNYLSGLFHGTFGLSIFVRQGVPVESFVWERIKWSVILSVIAIVLGAILSILFLFIVSYKVNGVTDRVFQFLVALFTALPSFIFTTLLLVMVSTSTSFPVLFEQSNFISWLLPIIAVAIPAAFTDFWRIRSQMVRVANQQFVKFATIKGLTKAKVIFKHLIPHALLPLAITLPLQFASSVTLMTLIESTFGIPGAGQLLFSATSSKDYNIILAIVIVQVFITAFAFPAQDLLARLLDPRYRRSK